MHTPTSTVLKQKPWPATGLPSADLRLCGMVHWGNDTRSNGRGFRRRQGRVCLQARICCGPWGLALLGHLGDCREHLRWSTEGEKSRCSSASWVPHQVRIAPEEPTVLAGFLLLGKHLNNNDNNDNNNDNYNNNKSLRRGKGLFQFKGYSPSQRKTEAELQAGTWRQKLKQRQ